MSGVRGRSGKVSTPEQRQRRADAAAKGGAARWAREDARDRAAATARQTSAGETAPAPLGDPLTWREAGSREYAALLKTKRERAALELAQQRRELVTRDQALAAACGVRDIIIREVDTLAATVGDLLRHALSVEDVRTVERAVAGAWLAARRRIAGGLERTSAPMPTQLDGALPRLASDVAEPPGRE